MGVFMKKGFRTNPGAGHDTVVCPECDERIGGDEPTCPFCDASLWGDNEDEEVFFKCTACKHVFPKYRDDFGEVPLSCGCERCDGEAIPEAEYDPSDYVGPARLRCDACRYVFKLEGVADTPDEENEGSPVGCTRCGKMEAYRVD